MANIEKKISTNFSRGLNQAASHMIHNNECQLAENFVFKDQSATVREGIRVHASLPAPVVALRKFYQKDGGNYFVAIAGGSLYNSVTSGSFTSVSSDAISSPVHHAVFDGAMYFTDYSGPVKYFDGNAVDIAGLSSPVFRKQIDDMEDVVQWSYNLYGALEEDITYTHRDKGNKSIRFSASSPANAAIFSLGAGIELNSEVHINTISEAGQNRAFRDLSGNMDVFYTSGTAANYTIYRAYSETSGVSWTHSTIVSGAWDKFAAAVDSSNNIQLAYLKGFIPTIAYVKKYSVDSGWVETTITSGAADYNERMSIAIDSSNDAHIIFIGEESSSPLKYVVNTAASGITALSSIAVYGANYANIAIDTSNIRHLVWQGSAGQIYYLNSLSSNTQTLTSTNVNSQSPVVAVDTSANVHIAFTSISGATYAVQYLRKYNGSAAWSNVDQVKSFDSYAAYWPSIALENNNKLNVVWYGNDAVSPSYRQVRYRSNLSSWSAIQNLTTAAKHQYYPALIYANHPTVGVNKIDAPTVGWAMTWFNGTTLQYRASQNLYWDGWTVPSTQINLNRFASDTSSDSQDIIQAFTVHHVKSDISSIAIQFVDSNSITATQEITALSSWQSCSNDEWALTHNMPKALFTVLSGFNWGSCNLQIRMTPVSSNPQKTAYCVVDNIRMVKTPPVITGTVSTAAESNLWMFGSSVTGNLIETPTCPPGYTYDPDRRACIKIMRAGDIYLPVTIEPSGAIPTADQLEGIKAVGDPLPSGIYYYKNTFLKGSPSGYEIESNPSAMTSSVVVSNATSSWTFIQLGNIPIAPDSMGVVGRRIYRRRSDEEEYRHVYTLHDNEITTFFDSVPTITLGHALEEDHVPPPQAKYIMRNSEQIMYYFNVIEEGNIYSSRVRFSNPYEPYYVPYKNIIDISPDDGTEGTGMFEFMNQTHFLKERSTWILNQGFPDMIHSSIGCISPKSLAIGKNEVFWVSEDGIIKYNLYRWENVSHSKDDSSKYRIQTLLDRLPKEYISNAVGTYYNGYYLLAVTDEGSTVNDTVICYDVDNDIFSIFPNINVNCWETWTGGKEGYRLFFGNNSGLICEFMTGNYDISTPIGSTIQTKDFGIPSPTEFFRKSYLFVKNLDSQDKTLAIQPYYDFVATSAHSDNQAISGTYNLLKIDLPQTDDASFFSMKITTSGRYRINQLDIYGKGENLR